MQLVKGKVTINVNPKGQLRAKFVAMEKFLCDLKGLVVVERAKKSWQRSCRIRILFFHGSVLSQVKRLRVQSNFTDELEDP